MKDQQFISSLRWLKHAWQAGLLLCDLMRLLGSAAATLAVYAVLDFFLAFDPEVCLVMDILVALTLAALVVLWLGRILRLTAPDMARRADALLKGRRRPILSALELHEWLSREQDRLPDLHAYLAQKSIANSSAEMGRLKFRDYFPFPELRKRFGIAAIQFCAAGILFCLNPAASKIIQTRILFPFRDTPPYSRYVFAVSPDRPRVIYGGTAEVSVDIGGAPVKSQVWFVTRYKGQTRRTACFQESGRLYAQRIEKVVSPVEFCFAVGRARSRWHKVDLLLQPEIAQAHVSLQPPRYTGLPVRQFPVGKEPLAGYRRSRVQLFVTSNRPLTDGLLTIRPKSGLGNDQSVAGERPTPNMISFSWLLLEDAELDVTIRDIRGTRNRDPFLITQKLIPDKPPEVAITEPAGFSLATPAITVPLSGYAADDLGVRKLDLVRTVVGYRDRTISLGPLAPDPQFAFNRKLDLKALGTMPGQTLEFYLEAADSNPAMTGVSVSDIVRLRIISDEEYAAMLREKSTLEDFVARYRVLDAALRRYVEAVRKLKEAAASSDAAGLDKALKDAGDANRQLRDLFQQLASDFPIFESEKSLADTLNNLLKTFKSQGLKLDQMTPPYSGAGIMAGEMLEELGAAQEQIREQTETAEEIALVARVMECAARFKQLVQQQTALVRRLDRFDKESSREMKLLASLGRQQDEVRGELLKLVGDIMERSAGLPREFDALRFTALRFADLIGSYEIPDLMHKATDAAGNQDGRQTLHFSTLALEKLKELVDNCAGTEFGGLCKGEITFSVADSTLKATLQQMLSSIMNRMGGRGKQGAVGAGGGMIGGDPNDGYWTGGYSPLNVPVFGPERRSFPGGDQGGMIFTGTGSGRGGARSSAKTASETMGNRGAMEIKAESLPLEQVPDKYRNAIKKYFSNEEIRHEK